MASDDSWVGDAQPYLAPRAAGEADAWTAEAAQRCRRGGQRLLGVEEVEPPAAVREFFGVGAGERVIVRRRLILLDGKPIELADSYYPASIAAGTPLAAPGKIRGGAVTLLAELGHTPDPEPIEDVGAAIATAPQCAALDLDPGSAVLILTRFTRSTAGEPIEVGIMTMTRHMQYQQRRQGS